MKKIIISIIAILIVVGGAYFVSLHLSKEKPKSLADLEIKEILDEKNAEDSLAAPGEVVREGLSLIAKGAFDPEAEGSDKFHRGSGGVSIIDFKGDQKVILEDDFTVTNGPDYMVYLVRGDVPQTEATFEAAKENFTNLGRMTQFSGYQTFDIPADISTSDVSGVVVWCEQFGEFISSAKFR